MMKRRTFMFTGASALASPALVHAQTARKVVVIGAGAAGIAAAYYLRRAGVEVQVLEARNRVGGRVLRLDGFADVPFDLGAEWIHGSPDLLDEIADEPVQGQVETIEYRPQTWEFWNRGNLKSRNLLRHAYAETKFRRTTWFGFFEKFLWPSVADVVRLNAPVERIEHRASGVRVTAASQSYDADHAIVTVPVSLLKAGAIDFDPAPPSDQAEAIRGFTFGQGFKVFMKFRERFYSDIMLTQSTFSALEDTWDNKTFYDATFRKDAQANVFGLFRASETPLPRARMEDGALIADVVAELDEIYDGQASRNLLGARAKNWTRDPYTRGVYSMDYDYKVMDSIEEIFAPLSGRVHFAGEALGGDNQSTVHGAAFSAKRVVSDLT